MGHNAEPDIFDGIYPIDQVKILQVKNKISALSPWQSGRLPSIGKKNLGHVP